MAEKLQDLYAVCIWYSWKHSFHLPKFIFGSNESFLFSKNVALIPAPLEDIPERSYEKELSSSPSPWTWIRWLACAGGRDQVNWIIQNILITISVANNVFFFILEYRFPHHLNKSSELKSFLEEPWRLRSQTLFKRKNSGKSLPKFCEECQFSILFWKTIFKRFMTDFF